MKAAIERRMTGVRLPLPLHEALRKAAYEKHVSQNELMVEAITAHLISIARIEITPDRDSLRGVREAVQALRVRLQDADDADPA